MAATNLELLIAFEADDEAQRVSLQVRHRKQRHLMRLCQFLGDRSLLEATTADLSTWRVSSGVRRATRVNYVSDFDAFYRWAMACGLTTTNPAAPLAGRRVNRLDYGDFHKLMVRFRIAQEHRNLAWKTIWKRRWELRLLADFIAPRSVLEVTPAEVESWLDSRRLSSQARRAYLSNLYAFFKWALREGIVESDPTVNVEPLRATQHLPRPISDADLALAMANATPRVRAMLALAAFEGLRRQEIGAVAREDILDQNEPPLLLVCKGKGRKQRLVPLHPEAWKAVSAHGLPRSGYVFGTQPSKVAEGWAISHIVNTHLHGLGLTATAHRLRHWFGSRLYATTKDLRLTQEMLGHSSPTTTAIYVAYNPGDAVGAVTALAIGG